MNVAAIIVTRGDVDLAPIFRSLPKLWERIVWDNGARQRRALRPGYIGDEPEAEWDVVPVEDRAVAGRYEAIAHTRRQLIYTQDDDVVVDDPRALLRLWSATRSILQHEDFAVCNMPEEFRHDFYREHALVGFGAMFRHDLPRRAFERYARRAATVDARSHLHAAATDRAYIDRTADVIFTALTSKVLADEPKHDLEHATAPTRMYRRKEHQAEREAALQVAIEARDLRTT